MKHIYVDANGTYPVAPTHFDEVAATLKMVDGNPSSIHALGRNAKIALEDARTAVAKLVGASAPEIVFTSGATEANNFALNGALFGARTQTLPSFVVSSVEHSAVLETVKALKDRNLCDYAVAPVKATGDLDENSLLALITPRTTAVALIAANNETGVMYPVEALAKTIRGISPGIHIHVDAVQLLGKSDLSWLAKSEINSAAFSGHKVGAYKGVGALYLRRGTKLSSHLTGGGQERGRRAGTENLPGIVSFGIRAKQLANEIPTVTSKMSALRQRWLEVLAKIPGAVVHGSAATMLPNTVNFHIDGVAGDDILLNFDLANIYASSGSACSSSVARPSHVLQAMGYSEWVSLNSVRVSFTADASMEDVAHMEAVLLQVIRRSGSMN